jgi:hypothetical protein
MIIAPIHISRIVHVLQKLAASSQTISEYQSIRPNSDGKRHPNSSKPTGSQYDVRISGMTRQITEIPYR